MSIVYRSVKGSRLTSDEVDGNFRFLENQVAGGNRFTAFTGFSLAGNVLTLNTGSAWVINTVSYTNAASVGITIPYAASGMERIDLIVANASNTFVRVAGVESASNPVAPAIPVNTVQATFVSVTDGTVGTDTDPIVGTEFVKKNEYAETVIEDSGDITIGLDSESTAFALTGAVTSIIGFEMSDVFVASNLYIGKKIKLTNNSGGDISIEHNGSATYPARFPLETDFVFKNNEVIVFEPVKRDQLFLQFVSVGRDGAVDMSGKEDSSNKKTTMTGNTTSNVFFLTAKAVYDWAVGKFQDILVSGTNIKTINGESVLGSGDLEISISENKVFVSSYSNSFGDSFTVGQAATAGNSYLDKLIALYSLTNTQRAVSGRGVWEAAKAHNQNITYGHSIFSTVMAGFNDIRNGGDNAKTLNKISGAFRAIIANQFMSFNFNGGLVHASVVRSGTWSVYNAQTYGGKYTGGNSATTSGDYIEYTFTNDNVVVGLIGSDGVAATYGTFTVHIDGVLQGTYDLNNKSDGISDGSNANTRSPFVVHFHGMDYAQHVIKITLTSSNLVPIDYFGHFQDPKICQPLLICEVAKMNAAGYAGGLSTDAITDQVNTLISSVIAEFPGEFPIFLAKTNDFYDVTTGISVDNIHPNNLGHSQIFNSVYDAMKGVILVRNILNTKNIFKGENTFNTQTTQKGRLLVQGNAGVVPTGAGLELEYNGTAGVIIAYNRDTGTWLEKATYALKQTFYASTVQKMEINSLGIKVELPTYADNAAAAAAGLPLKHEYQTATGERRIRV